MIKKTKERKEKESVSNYIFKRYGKARKTPQKRYNST